MKKRFITIVSLLLAFVMSFALIACGNDGEGDGGDNSSNAPVISASLAKLRSAEGYKGTVAIHAATGKHANAVNFDGEIEKRGNKYKATTGEAATAKEYILDTTTGYVYQNSEQGYYFKQYAPQGIADYAQYMVGVLLENAGDKSLDDLFVYDGNTHTATYKYDGADTVNAYLAPIVSAYKNNSNLLTLVNNYLKLVSPDPTRPYTAEAILDMAVTLVASQPNLTMGAMIEMAANYGIDVYGLLEKSGLLQKFGITLDAPTKAKIEARKVAEFVTALDEILNTIKDDPNILENIPALIDKLFVDEVTVTDLRASLTNIRNYIVALLTVQQVKPIVDKYFGGVVPAYMSEIYAVIVNGVEIEKLDVTVSLKFDEDNNIIGIAANGNFAHDYSGDAANFYVLSDNDYHFDIALDITEYLTAPSAFEIEFADSAWEASNRKAFAVVYGTFGDEVSVYLETGGKDINVTVSANTSFMTYDAATHTFKFDMNAVYAAYQEQIAAGTFDGFSGVAFVDGEDAPVTVAVQILPETPDGLLEMLGELLNKISSAPSEGSNITEQPVQ